MLHNGMRIDRAIGRAASFFGNMMSNKKDLTAADFSPYDVEQDKEGTIDDIASLLSAIAKKD